MRKSTRWAGLLTLAITLLAIAPGGTSASSSPTTAADLNTLGSSTGNVNLSSGLNAQVHQAERNESGNLLSVTWSIQNSGGENVSITWLGAYSYSYSGPYFSGVTIVDSNTPNRFHPVMDGSGACVCSGKTSNDFRRRIRPNEQVAYWSLFSVPGDVDSVNVEIPGFDPIEDVPIS